MSRAQTISRKDSDKCKQSGDWLKQIPEPVGYYLSGFADGEGSFNVSMRRRNDHTLGWQIVLTFNVSQRDKTVLLLLQQHLGCGRLQARKDGVWYYVVSSPQAIIERVIPFFDKFGLLSVGKRNNYLIFKQIAGLVNDGQHRDARGIRIIIELREKLNLGRGRKRQYDLADYQKFLSENPQRLYARIQPRKRVMDMI